MPVRPAIPSCLPLALSVAVAILIHNSPAIVLAQTQTLDQPAPIATMLDTLEREPDPQLRVHTSYRMLHAFDRGTVHFQDAALAERFAQVMGHLMRSDTATTVAWQAAELMMRFPHPAATEALLEVAQRGGGAEQLGTQQRAGGAGGPARAARAASAPDGARPTMRRRPSRPR